MFNLPKKKKPIHTDLTRPSKKTLRSGYDFWYIQNLKATVLKETNPQVALKKLEKLEFPIYIGDNLRRQDPSYKRNLEIWRNFHKTPKWTTLTSDYLSKLLANRRFDWLKQSTLMKTTISPGMLLRTKKRRYCRFKSSFFKLKLQALLQSILATPVTITSQNLLKLKAANVLLAYGWKVTQALPTQYIYAFFFQKDLTNVIVCTVLLRTSSLLSFYLARLLERVPRHTWFFHIFNRIVAVFKFYCRVPLSLKVVVKGRVNKKLRKQSVCLLRTQLATSTFDSSIDYSLTHSFTSASVLGIKVWVVSFTKAAFVKTFAQKYQAY